MKVAVGNNKMLQQFFETIHCMLSKKYSQFSTISISVYKHKINLSIIYSIIHWYTRIVHHMIQVIQ